MSKEQVCGLTGLRLNAGTMSPMHNLANSDPENGSRRSMSRYVHFLWKQNPRIGPLYLLLTPRYKLFHGLTTSPLIFLKSRKGGFHDI